jgi:hypothetical protein
VVVRVLIGAQAAEGGLDPKVQEHRDARSFAGREHGFGGPTYSPEIQTVTAPMSHEDSDEWQSYAW